MTKWFEAFFLVPLLAQETRIFTPIGDALQQVVDVRDCDRLALHTFCHIRYTVMLLLRDSRVADIIRMNGIEVRTIC